MMVEQIDWAGFYDGSDNDEKFRAFHKENPHVLDRLISMTEKLVRQGHKRVGIAMLFEVLRYDYMLQTNDEPFKLNNNHKAYYSRLIMRIRPEWEGIFQVRESAADSAALTDSAPKSTHQEDEK